MKFPRLKGSFCFVSVMQDVKNQGEVDKLLDELDFNGDNMIDFTEFTILVTTFSCAIYKTIKG